MSKQNNNKEKSEFSWKNFILTTIASSMITSVILLLPFHPVQQQLGILKKQYNIQYTPDLRMYINSGVDIYVGKGDKIKRVDDVISIPLIIFNKGYGLAKNIRLAMVYNDGASEYKITEPPLTIPFLEGIKSTVLPVFYQSILANSYELYSKRGKIFKMKIFLSWEDINKTKYNSVELFKLDRTEFYPDYPSSFVFRSQGFYSSIENKSDIQKYSAYRIDF